MQIDAFYVCHDCTCDAQDDDSSSKGCCGECGIVSNDAQCGLSIVLAHVQNL